jgi:hypothetical protein
MGKMSELMIDLMNRDPSMNLYPRMPTDDPEPCDECYGTGEVPDSYHDKTGKGDPCKKCNGTGMI